MANNEQRQNWPPPPTAPEVTTVEEKDPETGKIINRSVTERERVTPAYVVRAKDGHYLSTPRLKDRQIRTFLSVRQAERAIKALSLEEATIYYVTITEKFMRTTSIVVEESV